MVSGYILTLTYEYVSNNIYTQKYIYKHSCTTLWWLSSFHINVLLLVTHPHRHQHLERVDRDVEKMTHELDIVTSENETLKRLLAAKDIILHMTSQKSQKLEVFEQYRLCCHMLYIINKIYELYDKLNVDFHMPSK